MATFVFEDFVLDAKKGELKRAGEPVELEPQVFRLLLLLVESGGRLVDRDELMESIWKGRVVSDSAISSRIKSLRKALGDDGKQQRLLRTVPKRGFRFVGEVSAPEASASSSEVTSLRADLAAEAESVARPSDLGARPSIAVLPFSATTSDEQTTIVASALPDELITELARLRWLFIIARGSSFRFRSFESEPQTVKNALGVRYCLSGAVETINQRVALSVELTDLDNGSVVWAERYGGGVQELGELREQIKSAVVGAMELEIPLHEASRARLIDPGDLSTWASYHLGVQHLNRFTPDDVRRSIDYFQRAVKLEPDFARAHSALSAAHFQLAFQHVSNDDKGESRLARVHAERGMALDPQDPFANFVMGRVHWLEGDIPLSQEWLERSIRLSPSSAKSHYALAFADGILGNHQQADSGVTAALSLSPLDPFRYGMLGVRSFVCLWERDFERAARWSRAAATSPGAHALIQLIAVAAHDLNQQPQEAKNWADKARAMHNDVSAAHFFNAFPFEEPELRALLESSLLRYGF